MEEKDSEARKSMRISDSKFASTIIGMGAAGARRLGIGTAGAIALLALSWAGYALVTWARYGRGGATRTGALRDPLLDRFLPEYDIHERHETRVAVPAALTFAAAREMDLSRSPLVRAIFAGRELMMGASPGESARPRTLLAQTLALGWRVLAEEPGRVVVGAVTQPWEADVVFRGLSPEAYTAFEEPAYVKIVWTLEVEPLGDSMSVFRTQTRVATTDTYARSRFRRYWAVFSPGILLIRLESLRLVKADAERRARGAPLRGQQPMSEKPV